MMSSENLRPKRSRKDRPCDRCRRSKRSCHISVRGEACEHCRKAGRVCSFIGPPLNRHRRPDINDEHNNNTNNVNSTDNAVVSPVRSAPHAPVSVPSVGSTQTMGGGAADEPSTSSARTGPNASGTSELPPPQPPSHFAFPHIPQGGPPPPPWASGSLLDRHRHSGPVLTAPSASVVAFLDCLEDDPRRHESQNDDDLHYSSLDMGVTEEEESHYLGYGAVAQLASVSLDARIEQRNADALPYRQVADPRYPAYFLKNPSKVYGLSNAAFVAEKAYQHVHGILSGLDPALPERLIQHFNTRTLPALPIINNVRFEASLGGWQGVGCYPYALLISIYAHSAVYEPSLRRHQREFWSVLLHVLDNEYRQPRLQTIQLELFNLAGRPIINPGGNHLGICRAVGAVQLLGLHRDSSNWKLPSWERSLRKRLWWALYVHDKWNSYTYGRPINIEGDRSNIPPLTFEDDDHGGKSRPPDKASDISSFIALCRLSVILENLLPLLLERDGQSRPHSLDRSLLRHSAKELDAVYRELPDDLIFHPSNPPMMPRRPGAASLQLTHAGISLLICRLGLEREHGLSLTHLVHGNKYALTVLESLAALLESLTGQDYHAYWSAWSAYQLSNAVTLLLQQAIRIDQHTGTPDHRGEDNRLRRQSLDDTFAVLDRLVRIIQAAAERGFEVADASLPRIKSLIKSMPPIHGVEKIQAILAGPPMPAVPELTGALVEVEPNIDVLALFDWLNGDMTSVF